MSKTGLLNYTASSAEFLLCAVALTILVANRQIRQYLYFGVFLAVRLWADAAMGLLIYEARHQAPVYGPAIYRVYFFVYWISYAVEAALVLLAISGIYRLAMAPLDGLRRLGTLVFRWIVSISAAVSISVAFGPDVTSFDFMIRAVTKLQQTSSVLTLCILLFVCLAIRPMGLSFKSRIFGLSLGLGLLATTNLVASAWLVNNRNMYSTLSIIESLAVCGSFVIWTLYLVFPEPKRRMIILPTTSPFLWWNQISAALGDEPGYVAVAGVPPEMFAEAEIEIMTRASRKMNDAGRGFDFASQLAPAHLASLSVMGTEARVTRREADCTLV